MKVMVFGSTGALGTALKIVCKKRDIQHIEISHKYVDVYGNSSKAFDFIDKHKPDVVVNAIAIIGAQRCLEDIEWSTTINSLFPEWLSLYCNNKSIILI